MLLCFFFSAVPLERVSFQGVEMWVSFFPVTPLEEHMSLLASGVGYDLPHRAAGGACVTPGPREVVIFFPITPPEEHVSLRGVGR